MEATTITLLTLVGASVALALFATAWTANRARRYDRIIDHDTSDYSSLNELPEIDTTPTPRFVSRAAGRRPVQPTAML